jgi:hypothetical protein
MLGEYALEPRLTVTTKRHSVLLRLRSEKCPDERSVRRHDVAAHAERRAVEGEKRHRLFTLVEATQEGDKGMGREHRTLPLVFVSQSRREVDRVLRC